MKLENILLLKLFLFTYVVCTVLGEHQKRDVHKIVLKERVPRSHKKGHNHSHSKSKKRKQIKKRPVSSEEDSSSSEEKRSSSEEDSFEEIIHRHKGRESQYKQTMPFNKPSHTPFLDIAESRPAPYKEDLSPYLHGQWVPLNHDHLHHSSYENIRNARKKRKEVKTKKHRREKYQPFIFEDTTPYPPISPIYDISTFYPPLNVYPHAPSNYIINKKISESNQSQLIGTIEQPKLEFRNQENTYEVKEDVSNNTPTIIAVPDINASQQESKLVSDLPEEEHTSSTPITVVKKRGRNHLRGRSRF